MGQEFFINSERLESKVRQLLPSQGGAGAGFDLSASTQIIPVINLTESAEGSDVRIDLQTALSLTNITHTSTSNTTNNLITTTGYYRIFGSMFVNGSGNGRIELTDGTTTKRALVFFGNTSSFLNLESFDFIIYLPAGVTCRAVSTTADISVDTTTRQIADIDGNLVDPI